MKNSPADILRYYSASAGVCSLPESNKAWPGYVNYMAGVVDNAILFTDVTGTKDGRYQRTGETVEHPGVQVLSRSTDQNTGWQRIDALAKLFDATGRQAVTVGSSSYTILSINRKGNIMPLNTEEHYKALERQTKEVKINRFIFVLNIIMTLDSDIVYVSLPSSITLPSPSTFWHTQSPAGTINGTNKVFTVTPFTATTTILTIDGVIVSGYTITATTITFTVAPTGTTMLLSYF